VAAPVSAIGEQKIDCHCHVFDPANFPYREDVSYRPAGQEIGTAAQFGALCEAYRVEHALLVGPNSGYGEDNRYLLHAIAHGGGRFKGVAVVANDASEGLLADLKRQGVVGITLNATFHGVDYYRNMRPLIRRLVELDLFLQIQVEGDQLIGLAPVIENSDVRIIVDHCGRPIPDRGLSQAGFAMLCALGRSGRAAVKLSGLAKFSQMAFPHEDAWPYVHALADAFGLDRCLWGSDWPFLRAPQRMDYGPLLSLVDRLVPDPEARRKLLWDSPRRLFGFGTA
jgi:predicted TIM-barrel fold metal-dependent hydrolase